MCVCGGCVCVCVCVGVYTLSHSVVSSSLQPPRTAARQVALSVEFSRQEFRSGLPSPPSGDLPDWGLNPSLLQLLPWEVDSFPLCWAAKCGPLQRMCACDRVHQTREETCDWVCKGMFASLKVCNLNVPMWGLGVPKKSEAVFFFFFFLADNQERSPEQHQGRGLLVNVFEKRINRMVWAWCGEKDCKRNWKESGNSGVTFHHNREPETCWKDCRTLASLGSKVFGSVQLQKPLGWLASLRCPSVKESACPCKRCQRHVFNPWVRKMPLEKKQQLTLVFFAWRLPWNLVGCSPWGWKESDTTEQLSTWHFSMSSWRYSSAN